MINLISRHVIKKMRVKVISILNIKKIVLGEEIKFKIFT